MTAGTAGGRTVGEVTAGPGWRTCHHTTGRYDYYAADIDPYDYYETGDVGPGVVAVVYADPTHREVEVLATDALNPAEARALAARLVEAADLIAVSSVHPQVTT